IERQGSGQPIYALGTYPAGPSTLDFIEQIDPVAHTLNWRDNHAPADMLIPTLDGFWSTRKDPNSTNYYLEHDPNGVFDWGKQYPNYAGTSVGFTAFQNAVYIAVQSTSPAQLIIDRFVSGPTIQSISLPASVLSGQQATLTITLN